MPAALLDTFCNGTTYTNLSSSISSGATSITILNATRFPTSGNYRIRIEDELLLVTAGQGTTTWTVTRGIEGTTAASHSGGSAVIFAVTEQSIKNWFRQEKIITGIYANRPTSAPQGTLYFNIDTLFYSYYNNGAWEEYGPIYRTYPFNFAASGSGYSLVGASGSTTTTTNGLFSLSVPAGSGSDSWRCYLATMPTKPFTVTMRMDIMAKPENFWTAGFIVRDSSGGKFGSYGYTWRSGNGGTTIECVRWTNLTTFNSFLDTTRMPWLINCRPWFRFRVTSSIIAADWSADKLTWRQWHTEGLTDFIPSPDQIGIGASSTNSESCILNVSSWEVN